MQTAVFRDSCNYTDLSGSRLLWGDEREQQRALQSNDIMIHTV